MQTDRKELQTPEERFDHYVEVLTEAVGHADRAEPLRAYTTGLLLPGERKSVEPMAARLAPRNVRRKHQSMHHFVADAPWSDERVLARARAFSPSRLCARMDPLRLGSLMTPAFPRKAPTRRAWRASIAGS